MYLILTIDGYHQDGKQREWLSIHLLPIARMFYAVWGPIRLTRHLQKCAANRMTNLRRFIPKNPVSYTIILSDDEERWWFHAFSTMCMIFSPFGMADTRFRPARYQMELVLSCVIHETVNHSQNFVDPITGAHIQGMESGWNRVNTGLKSKRVSHEPTSVLPGRVYVDWLEGRQRRLSGSASNYTPWLS